MEVAEQSKNRIRNLVFMRVKLKGERFFTKYTFIKKYLSKCKAFFEVNKEIVSVKYGLKISWKQS